MRLYDLGQSSEGNLWLCVYPDDRGSFLVVSTFEAHEPANRGTGEARAKPLRVSALTGTPESTTSSEGTEHAGEDERGDSRGLGDGS